MGNRVTVTFVGVCAIVPDEPFFEYINGKWVRGRKAPSKISVLLPNLSEPNVSSWSQLAPMGSPSTILKNHTPVMAFRLRDLLSKESISPDMIIRDPVTEEEIGLIVLTERHVRPETHVTPKGLSCDLRESTSATPSAGEERSLWWLPRMGEISATHDTVPRRLDPTNFPSLKNSKVLATFQFTGGSVYVDDFSRSIGKNKERPWKFSRIKWVGGQYQPVGGDYWLKSLGNKVSVDMPFLEDSFTFGIREKKADPSAKIVLRPSQLLRRAHLWIANLEPDALASLLVKVNSISQVHLSADPDFEAFYRMVGAQIQDFGPVPYRKGQETGDYLRPCSPVGFSRFQ